jgi:hypothetical protein
MCLFTRYVIAVPLTSKRGTVVAEALFTHVFATHGIPKTVRSDEGKKFVNAALLRLYQQWGIQPILTGGYRPWDNPVERYDRYLNSCMTMLSTAFGEDWTRYLQAAVFTYNASVSRSTGFSPYYLMHVREPALLEEVTVGPTFNQDGSSSINDITKRLKQSFTLVRKQQAKVAETNRKAREAKSKNMVYEIDDHVMYWKPSQPKYLGLAISGEQPLADTELARRKAWAHRSWKCRWTGPHRIVKCLPGKYSNRYTLHHIKRGDIENIKTDRLYPYEPWSTAHPSTSPELDDSTTRTRSHNKIGTWCSANSFFIVALQRPHPFGVGKVI